VVLNKVKGCFLVSTTLIPILFFTEKHVKLLTQLQQPVPPNISIMLSEMKRREEKKHAKRLANRKSASTSRARKKALVQEMTELNARLKRQALILSLLPDLVIVVNLDGVVTFCNEQVERVLSHKSSDLVGTKLVNILVPSSRRRLENLMKTLSKSSHRDPISETTLIERDETTRPGPDLNCAEEAAGASQEVAEISSSDVAACAAGQSTFPLSVVQVATLPQRGSSSSGGGSDENENSDESGGNAEGKDSKQASSLTNSGTISGSSSLRPQSSSCLDNNGFDSVSMMKDKPASDSAMGANLKSSKDSASCDISNTSSLSTLKKLRSANDNLIINVRWHNRNIKDNKKAGTFKDDVTGDDVTANNASARLSSLRHHRESSSEEDSGYRESNESREETSSSTSDLSDTNGK
jgi:PAS domain S-box-containing protein